MPEKIAEKRHHPQKDAIHTLCLLSLAFGGLLWPLAWLWAYTKPVLHKMAYGTDVDESLSHVGHEVTEEEHFLATYRHGMTLFEQEVTAAKASSARSRSARFTWTGLRCGGICRAKLSRFCTICFVRCASSRITRRSDFANSGTSG